MAGVYIHVPFCKQLCFYCDFHFSLSLRFKDPMVGAILQELDLRADYLPKEPVETIYFGGGTPSVLAPADLELLLNKVHQLYSVAPDAEITLEANPDDLTPEYLRAIKAIGFNRLSIGIQSFIDSELKFMNRRHTAVDAEKAVHAALDEGIENLTVDLIYGLPNSTLETWRYSLEKAMSLPIPHFSCYHLGIEEKTAFADFKKKGKLVEVTEEASWEQYQLLCKTMQTRGYQHYEISNFSKPNWHSRHNSAYWNGTPYIGVGPSAHSFDGSNREWNISHNDKYRKTVDAGTVPCEQERLTSHERFNDYLLTQLRTAKGVNEAFLLENFPDLFADFSQAFAKYKNTDLLHTNGTNLALTEKGMFRSDAIISDLFAVD